ncbi:GATA transcription factor 4-like [Lotus japonicus]|uniref:GATA transcription factor 4-like n=1 Tax=Lotus japonicus TaxID=34305 RepID=UPI00258EB7A6|nr:GATA transcription factor 4-like [Lotus japonicus]
MLTLSLSHSSARSFAPSPSIYQSIIIPHFSKTNKQNFPSLSFTPTQSITTMDMYGSLSNPPDRRRNIDDFLDFSHNHLPPPQHSFSDQFSGDPNFFSNFPSVPRDEAAELEWLSHFVDDTTSFHDLPPSHAIPMGSQTTSFLSNNNDEGEKSNSCYRNSSDVIASVTGKSRSKRAAAVEGSPAGEGGVRRCSHCASEKTPQWRTGPLGPKTLCNACGVRFKSGRLVPEYRPAASPTFVLSQHSNSHRKVMELRRQKELIRHQQQPQQQQQQCYLHKQDFKVC